MKPETSFEARILCAISLISWIMGNALVFGRNYVCTAVLPVDARD